MGAVLGVLAAAWLILSVIGGVIALATAITSRDGPRGLWNRRTRAGIVTGAVSCLVAFGAPFSVEVVGEGGDNTVGWISLLLALPASFFAARCLPRAWAPFGGAAVFTGSLIALAWGYWLTHVWHLEGRTTGDLASDDMGTGAYWFGVIFGTWLSILPGLVIGWLSLIRRPDAKGVSSPSNIDRIRDTMTS